MTRFRLLKWLLGLVFLATGLSLSPGADGEKVTYYVQLVRGGNDATPPEPGARRIGPKLSARFRPVFKWEHYWEIHRQEVALAGGQKANLRLNPERTVAIDLTNPAKRKVTAYQSGKLIACTTHPASETMSIIGGERDRNSAWFIVVRRDKPTEAQVSSK